MMNNKPTIDELLRKLPVAQTGSHFTESVMSRIAALPQKTVRKLTPWHIAFIIAGSLLLMILAGWLAHAVWGVEFTFLRHLGNLFADTGISLLSLFNGVCVPSGMLSGLIGGVFLLLFDAWLRSRQRKHDVQEV